MIIFKNRLLYLSKTGVIKIGEMTVYKPGFVSLFTEVNKVTIIRLGLKSL